MSSSQPGFGVEFLENVLDVFADRFRRGSFHCEPIHHARDKIFATELHQHDCHQYEREQAATGGEAGGVER